MDLRRLSSVADFFVLATVASQRQMRAIIESVETDLKRLGQRVRHVEGREALRPDKVGAAHGRAPRGARHFLASEDCAGSVGRAGSPDSSDGLSWVVMDCGAFVVHLFTPPARQFYQLERLWGDAPRTPITS